MLKKKSVLDVIKELRFLLLKILYVAYPLTLIFLK